ncbi:YHYH protein [Granulosicoccus sp. 3-233]|uniref:YHYH protein n=1 Tax=Granulosicoccus sp. 3-233 TaxID=3417969 RepID=UPI003D34BC5E
MTPTPIPGAVCRPRRLLAVTALSIASLLAAACSSDDDSNTAEQTPETDTDTDTDTDTAISSLDPENFVAGALASEPVVVDCTLNDGTTSSCYQIEIAGVPADAAVGPFCPPSINSTAEEAGIWQDGTGIVHEADGNFILDLPNLYGSAYPGSDWLLYDSETGLVNITDTQEACEAAARPDVDPAYQNHCVECSLSYVDGGVSQTFLIPVTPVPADSIGQTGTAVGISLNGVELAAPAPVSDILSNYTIAAFDDCGGHVNPVDGYHYHAATGCTEASSGGFEADGHAALLGYALDGYGIHGQLDIDGAETEVLDECRGATDEIRGYHYHAASAGENMFIGCHHGKTAISDDDIPGGGPGGPGGPPQ